MKPIWFGVAFGVSFIRCHAVAFTVSQMAPSSIVGGPSLLFEAQRVNETVRVVGGSRDCELYRHEVAVRHEAQHGI